MHCTQARLLNPSLMRTAVHACASPVAAVCIRSRFTRIARRMQVPALIAATELQLPHQQHPTTSDVHVLWLIWVNVSSFTL